MKKYTQGKDGWYSTLVWDGTYINGKKHRKQIRSNKSSADLEKKVAAFKKQVEERSIAVSSDMTIGQFYDHWIEFKKPDIKHNTLVSYSNMRYYITDIENIRLSDLSEQHIKVCIQEAPEGTRPMFYTVIKSCLRRAVKERLISQVQFNDIFEDIKMPKPNRSERRGLTKDEREGFLNAEYKTENAKAIVYIAYGTGLRKGEILALTVDDIDLEHRLINVDKTWIRKNGTNVIQNSTKSATGKRKVPIPAFLYEYLKEFTMNKSGALIQGKNGHIDEGEYITYFNQIRSAFKKYKGYEVNDISIHNFRHNYCSSLCYQIPKVSIPTIAKLMGDSTEVVMKVYSHILQDMEDQEGAIEAALNIE